MRARSAALAYRQAKVALCVGLLAASVVGLVSAPAQAGSSTHAKTVPGSDTAESKQASARPEESAAEPSAQPAEKTAKANPAKDTAASAPEDDEALQASTVSPVGGAWETSTLVRPDAADEEITDAEALEIINRVNAYFNALKKAKAQFVQFDANNEKKSGDFYFKRPGKVRFDYDRPSRMKIISNGEYLAVENHDLRTADRYPLESTPFKLLLAEEVDLLNDARILSLDKGEDALILAVEDKSGESAGQIRLFFRTDPELRLASWIITDAQGTTTRVNLAEFQRDVQLSAELFEFSDIGLPDFNR